METNLIYCGDNLEVLSKFPEKSVDLIYADPPFFSNKHYEIIWGNGAEMKVYEDRWKGGINVYIKWMQERLWQCYRVLKDTGSMYLHCDWRASHRLRVAMDDIFGEENFRNVLIWSYGGRGAKAISRQFPRNYDTILFHAKSSKTIFNKRYKTERIAIADAREYGFRKDQEGRWFKTAPRGDYTDESVKRLEAEDRIYRTRSGKVRIKYFLREEGGFILEEKLVGNVWDDIPDMMHARGEYLGYPTQKPEALLKRIIEASSNKGDIVLDPFCGCGTTLVVAQQLDRKWVGIDVSPIACSLMRDRLNKVGASDVRIIGAPKTIDELKALQPFQFQNWVIDRIGGVPSSKKSSDMGIDGFTFMARDPVQVKQSEGVGRNVVDNFETAIRREHKTTGYIVAFSFAKSSYEEAARSKLENGLDIRLVRVDEMDKYF